MHRDYEGWGGDWTGYSGTGGYGKTKTYPSSIKLIIPDEIYQKIIWWVRKATGECSGFGKVVYKDGAFRVESAMLVKQSNSSAETEIDGGDLAKAMYDLREAPGDLVWWWHSHVNMDVFWSSTDREAIEMVGAGGYCIATVFNKRCEYLSAYYRPEKDEIPGVFIDELDTSFPRTLPAEMTAPWEKEFEEKCAVKTYSVPTSTKTPFSSKLDDLPLIKEFVDHVKSKDVLWDNDLRWKCYNLTEKLKKWDPDMEAAIMDTYRSSPRATYSDSLIMVCRSNKEFFADTVQFLSLWHKTKAIETDKTDKKNQPKLPPPDKAGADAKKEKEEATA
jgi:proteasome lid subunit RPN8/RPN11